MKHILISEVPLPGISVILPMMLFQLGKNDIKLYEGNMIFSDWREKSKDLQISKSLLWEYDLSDFSWNAMRITVMQRVIERGWMNDFYAAIRIYGGINRVKEIIKEIPSLSDKDMTFVCSVFDLRKEDLKCYIRNQSRERRLSY